MSVSLCDIIISVITINYINVFSTNKAVKDIGVIKTKLLLHFKYENKSFVTGRKIIMN